MRSRPIATSANTGPDGRGVVDLKEVQQLEGGAREDQREQEHPPVAPTQRT